MYLSIAVIGTGGTGAAFLSRFCQFLFGQDKERYHLSICDGDTVELRNCERQAGFLPTDVGRSKSSVLSEVFNSMYSLDISYCNKYIETIEDIDDLFVTKYGKCVKVLIGTVDNHAARLVMDKYFRKAPGPILYIDSGNEFSNGQVVFGAKNAKGQIFSPPASEYFPEIKKGGISKKDEGCEAVNRSAPQHLAVNALAGVVLCSALCDFFASGKTPTGITYFDCFKMFMRHDDVSEEYLERFKPKPRKKKASGKIPEKKAKPKKKAVSA